MTIETRDDQLLLAVKYTHPYSSRDGKQKKIYQMHPQRNVKGKGAGNFSIRRKDNTRDQQYVTEMELSELFAVDGFVKLGINLRMRSVDKYEGGAAPGLQPSISDVEFGSSFWIEVNKQCQVIQGRGLSRNLHLKLVEMGVPCPQDLLPRNPGSFLKSQVPNGSDSDETLSRAKVRSISEDDLIEILNRQRENGASGERIVLEWEKKRLRGCGCLSPEGFVVHTSRENVAAGFDIHSNWNGDQERFIEVKTTSSEAKYFFMSENEKEVLKEKSGKAFIYIVDLDPTEKTSGTVRTPIRFDADLFVFEPIAYRVRLKD